MVETLRVSAGVSTRGVESKSLEVGKSLKIGKNRIKSEKSEFITNDAVYGWIPASLSDDTTAFFGQQQRYLT